MSNGSPPLTTVSSYNPAQWYWKIGDETKVYFSGTNVRVDVSDQTYQDWLTAGHVVTPIPTEVELWDVLHSALPDKFPDWMWNGTTFIQPAPNNYTQAQIRQYSAMVRFNKETGGIIFRSHPINTNREAAAQIDTAVTQGNANPALTWNWKCKDGSWWLIDVPTQRAMATATGQHIDKCFKTEADIYNNASITTTNQVDDLFTFSNVYS